VANNYRRRVALFLISALLVPAAVLAQAPRIKDEGWSELLPPGEGRQLVADSCVGCHNLKVVVSGRKTRAEWAKSVNDMIQRGAQLFSDEIDPITTYLTKTFPPELARSVNVNTAMREDLEKLPNLKPEIAARILEARGKASSFKNSEELRQALGMEKADFEKFQYLLRYND